MHSISRFALLVTLAWGAAWSAQATPPQILHINTLPHSIASGPAPVVDLNDPRLFLNRPDAEAYAFKRAGIAKTAVDRKFETAEDLTGSLGFLCGLQPGAERSGAAAARGRDPSGRFIGAKLSLAFR